MVRRVAAGSLVLLSVKVLASEPSVEVLVQGIVGKSGEHPPRQLRPQRLKFQLS